MNALGWEVHCDVALDFDGKMSVLVRWQVQGGMLTGVYGGSLHNEVLVLALL